MGVIGIEEQVALLMQGSEYGDAQLQKAMADELRARLALAQREGRPLRVYCGYDPTRPDLHLGHTVTMRKLRQFQDLGHHIIFVIGDYTARIGDPSDKDALRPQLSEETIRANAATYAEQAFLILDRAHTELRFNSEWLSPLGMADWIRLCANFTLQQFVSRENFAKRWERGDAVYLHETFYSVMQGYDAYCLRADVQVGGSDQLFNIITAGRKVMEFYGVPPNIGVLLGILPGTDGVVRMSKSMGNHIAITADPADMYGKVMSIPDSAMLTYYRLLSRFTPPQVEEVERGLRDGGLHPRDAKMRLAHEIVAIYHDEEKAQQAEEHFRRVFQQDSLPEQMPEEVVAGAPRLSDWMAEHGLAKSRNDARRLIQQGGVRLDGQAVSDEAAVLDFAGEAVLQVGKRKFIRVRRNA
jgi:tyrosyl-tRNA synthetase